MRQYDAFFGGATLRVTARHPHEAQSAAAAAFNLPGRLQHMVSVRRVEEVAA
jgi:hypothetical protein